MPRCRTVRALSSVVLHRRQFGRRYIGAPKLILEQV